LDIGHVAKKPPGQDWAALGRSLLIFLSGVGIFSPVWIIIGGNQLVVFGGKARQRKPDMMVYN